MCHDRSKGKRRSLPVVARKVTRVTRGRRRRRPGECEGNVRARVEAFN